MRSSIGDVNNSWGTLSYWGLTSAGSTLDQRYILMGGTSQATPLVAGAAALVREWLVEVKNIVQPSSAMVKALLVHGADNISPGQYGTGSTQEIPSVSPNNISGWGRVDVANSLMTESNTSIMIDDHTSGINTGQTVTYTVNVGQSADESISNDLSPVDSEASILPGMPDQASGINSITEQLLKNPTFEQESNWALGRGTAYSTTYVHSGSHSMRVTGVTTASFYQVVRIPADATGLDLNFYWLNDNDDYPDAYFRVCLSTPLRDSHYACSGSLNSDQTTWHQTNLIFDSVMNSVRGKEVAVYFYAYVPGGFRPGISIYYIDDVALNVTTPNGIPTATPIPTVTPTPVPTLAPTPTPTPVPGTLGSLQATLVWTDYPGSTTAAKALVNDLDLVITAPDGTQYYGNSSAYNNGHTCLSNGHDRCNNTETIQISDAIQGQYTVTVTGYNVPQGGGQPYAIVITADQPLFAGDNFLYLPLLTR